MSPVPQNERSLGDLFAELSRETSTLVRSEVALAKNELTEKAAKVGRDASIIAIGGALAHAGLLVIIAAVVLLLVQAGLTSWLAAVIVGIAVAGTGYAIAQKGITALKHDDLTPRQTMDSMKETAQWAKHPTR
jgi:Putative Actinobacterial Holin-X, holin superfamily III